jgi:hypothetical protein
MVICAQGKKYISFFVASDTDYYIDNSIIRRYNKNNIRAKLLKSSDAKPGV